MQSSSFRKNHIVEVILASDVEFDNNQLAPVKESIKSRFKEVVILPTEKFTLLLKLKSFRRTTIILKKKTRILLFF